jgi:signal peptidase
VRRRLGFSRAFVLCALLGATSVTLGYVAAGYAFGWRALTVMSGSMEPAVGVGDVVIARQVPAGDAQPGQVITFADPDGHRKLITHRVRSVSVVDGMARFVTQGDANTGRERWSIPTGGNVGLVERRLPMVGYVAIWAKTRAGLLVLLIPLLALAALELYALWRPQKKVVPEPGPQAAESRS